MDHIETKILNSYTIQEAAQNMVFAARAAPYADCWIRRSKRYLPKTGEKIIKPEVPMIII